jgi:hypothetical protein
MEHHEHQVLFLKAIEAKFYAKGEPFGRKEFDHFLGQWGCPVRFSSLELHGRAARSIFRSEKYAKAYSTA